MTWHNLQHNRKNKSLSDGGLRRSTVVFPSHCLAIFYQRQEELEKATECKKNDGKSKRCFCASAIRCTARFRHVCDQSAARSAVAPPQWKWSCVLGTSPRRVTKMVTGTMGPVWFHSNGNAEICVPFCPDPFRKRGYILLLLPVVQTLLLLPL